MFVFPGAHDAIDALKALGVKLALVTNGAAETQRAKVERFELTHRFDHIQIEGEHGFGKPEERAYLHAMEALGVTAPDTWMIGDNLEWEVEAPQRLGIYAIWIDVHGDGLPPRLDRQARPHHPLADRTAACRVPIVRLTSWRERPRSTSIGRAISAAMRRQGTTSMTTPRTPT